MIDFKLYLMAGRPSRPFSKKGWAIGIAIFFGVTALAIYLLTWYRSTLP